MVLGQHKCAVGIFPSCQDTESALNELNDSGFSMNKMGVLAKDPSGESHGSNAQGAPQVFARPQDSAVTSVVTETTKVGLGSLLLVGLGILAIAGAGTAIEMGTGKTTLASIFPGHGIGAFADTWMGALRARGIPETQANIYSDRVSHGNYLVMVEGTDEEIATAERILSNWGIQEWSIYDAPKAEAVNS